MSFNKSELAIFMNASEIKELVDIAKRLPPEEVIELREYDLFRLRRLNSTGLSVCSVAIARTRLPRRVPPVWTCNGGRRPSTISRN